MIVSSVSGGERLIKKDMTGKSYCCLLMLGNDGITILGCYYG